MKFLYLLLLLSIFLSIVLSKDTNEESIAVKTKIIDADTQIRKLSRELKDERRLKPQNQERIADLENEINELKNQKIALMEQLRTLNAPSKRKVDPEALKERRELDEQEQRRKMMQQREDQIRRDRERVQAERREAADRKKHRRSSEL